MKDSQPVFAGIDVGASRTKVVILDHGQQIIGRAVVKSGTDFEAASHQCLTLALDMAGRTAGEIAKAMTTGYGRRNVAISQESKTEISCHARGCYYYFPRPITIIDIGGQDNKIIKLDESGKRTSFKMNRKCAAGTGAFLEEMSARLDIPLEDMDGLARQSLNMVELGSFCTVFQPQRCSKNPSGKKGNGHCQRPVFSVIKRVMEMDSLSEHVVMTGGVVAHNAFLVSMTEEMIGRRILVPEYPQLTGALGAALYAIENSNE